MKKRLIPIVVVLMAALLFSSSCTGRSVPVPFSDAKAEYLSGLPTEKAPSPDPSPSVPPTPRPTPSPTPSPSPTPVPYEGEEIAQYALQFNGYRYNYGGMDPSTGFDCSGLVYYVFRQFGYKLNRVAADQALNGIEVKTKADLLPGDIICFSWITNSYINHVGIYIGDGKFIHAMDSANDVVITKLTDYLETHRCVMRRIVGAEEKLSLSVIEEQERLDALALAERMAEEERIAAEQAKNASPTPTPPPAFIPDAGAISKAEAEEQHRKEIEEAWRAIWEEEPPTHEDAPTEPESQPSAGVEEPAPNENTPASSTEPENALPADPPPPAPDPEPQQNPDTGSNIEPEPNNTDSIFDGNIITITG
ncbi:MAG: C40 family peptidase [Oscillospiraceae bacterium]|nr:C40 family peptidase [Oscillospiraceae bacterium]